MHFHISKKHKYEKEIKLYLSSDILEIIGDYANKNEIEFNQSAIELIDKGYKYHQLEKLYNKDVNDREVWDKRYYFLIVESRYIHYKLKTRELYEELRNQTLQLASLLSRLEYCYQNYIPNQEISEEELKNIREMRKSLESYADKYLFANKDKLLKDEYIDDYEVIKSIEKILSKYKALIKNLKHRDARGFE